MSRAQELVDAHFDGYVGPLLAAAGVEEKVIALCAFMYKSSGIHFYKHAQEDAAEAARGALANAAAHKAPSLCDSGVKDVAMALCEACSVPCKLASPDTTECDNYV